MCEGVSWQPGDRVRVGNRMHGRIQPRGRCSFYALHVYIDSNICVLTHEYRNKYAYGCHLLVFVGMHSSEDISWC